MKYRVEVTEQTSRRLVFEVEAPDYNRACEYATLSVDSPMPGVRLLHTGDEEVIGLATTARPL